MIILPLIIIPVSLIAYIWCYRPELLPICVQRLYFKQFQKRVIDSAADDALMAYPLAVYVELTLPESFEKGGMSQVKVDLNKWLDEFSERIMGNIEQGLANNLEDSMEQEHRNTCRFLSLPLSRDKTKGTKHETQQLHH